MSYVRRSSYEFGDDDPVESMIAHKEHADHFRARARGRRLLLIADSLVSVLDAQGLLTDAVTARREMFHVLGDHLFGQAGAIDVPDFGDTRSLEALRRGTSDE